jgi:hypothetical protein
MKKYKKSTSKKHKYKKLKKNKHHEDDSSSDSDNEDTGKPQTTKENMTTITQYDAIQCYKNPNNRNGIISFNTYQTENTETLCNVNV